MRATWIPFALALVMSASYARADAGAPALVVVELFTSQGCSSCPPADALLVDLARNRPDVLPLAFHVTYWNRLGWRDPYSLDAATDRQRRYAALLPSNQVYTPQIVVDGSRDVVGSDRDRVLGAIRAATAKVATTSALASRERDGVKIEIRQRCGDDLADRLRRATPHLGHGRREWRPRPARSEYRAQLPVGRTLARGGGARPRPLTERRACGDHPATG